MKVVLVWLQPTRGQWKKVFYITSALYILGLVVFLIFGTGKVQRWNNPNNDVAEPVPSSDEQGEPLFDPSLSARSSKGESNSDS